MEQHPASPTVLSTEDFRLYAEARTLVTALLTCKASKMSNTAPAAQNAKKRLDFLPTLENTLLCSADKFVHDMVIDNELQEGLWFTKAPLYAVFLSLSFAFIAFSFWPSKRPLYGAATITNDAPTVGIDPDTWFSNLRGRYQYVRNGYWTIQKGYRKVC